eukprot:gene2602-2845_t
MPPVQLPSTHGRALLEELSRPDANLSKILSFIAQDRLAGRVTRRESGENSFHLLLQSGKPTAWLLEVLQALIESGPEGLKRQNLEDGNLPLHCYLRQRHVDVVVVQRLLTAWPESAGVANSHGLLPLFFSVMREDAQAEVCRALCKAFPAAVSTPSPSLCLPLHFAAKRVRPNLDILRILLRRYPEGARAVNAFGMLPLHCLCAFTRDPRAVEMVLEAYPEAIRVPDRQGRLALHLAVLSTAKEQDAALEKEMQDLRLQDPSHDDGNEDDTESSSDESEQVDEKDKRKQKEIVPNLREAGVVGGVGRQVVRLLVARHPVGLVTRNNFEAWPVDTVLEKTRVVRSRKKVVSVYGLYDDPITARLLLLLHRQHERSLKVAMPTRLLAALRELNWLARKEAVMLSLVLDPRPGTSKKKGRILPPPPPSVVEEVLRTNLLARLHSRGLEVLVHAIVLWI